MNKIDIFLFLSSFAGLFLSVLSYKELTFRKRLDYSIGNVLSFFIILICIILNKNYNITLLQAPLAFVLLMVANVCLFRDPLNVFVNTIVLNYIIVVI